MKTMGKRKDLFKLHNISLFSMFSFEDIVIILTTIILLLHFFLQTQSWYSEDILTNFFASIMLFSWIAIMLISLLLFVLQRLIKLSKNQGRFK